jgi:hypothetical protein
MIFLEMQTVPKLLICGIAIQFNIQEEFNL